MQENLKGHRLLNKTEEWLTIADEKLQIEEDRHSNQIKVKLTFEKS